MPKTKYTVRISVEKKEYRAGGGYWEPQILFAMEQTTEDRVLMEVWAQDVKDFNFWDTDEK